ncbi:MAG: hypothetical protein A2W99_00730 [Bacteroidetes bacterium GWF2_33_16]|nr:MAG: hypothetical protein A2X00_03435 [Bacteroidetes bacterium GWE2_32_14]OFY08790.1 MAG: hypothetical protein A2W99_00730 [Bacteroidetes bacterium GWF2_33_16]
MRRLITINLIVLFLFINHCSVAFAENNQEKEDEIKNQNVTVADYSFLLNESTNLTLLPQSDDVRLALMNIQIDVLGVLFFGPQVSLDFQIANFLAIGPDFSWHYAGFLYQGFMTEFFSDGTTLGIGTYGIGGHMKFLIPVGSGSNRPYVGFGYEKFYGEETYDDWDLGMKYSDYKSNVLHFDLGYKRLTEGSFNFSIGLSIAVSKVAESRYYYESDPNEINYYEPGETMVFPLLQMALGWQIGPH